LQDFSVLHAKTLQFSATKINSIRMQKTVYLIFNEGLLIFFQKVLTESELFCAEFLLERVRHVALGISHEQATF